MKKITETILQPVYNLAVKLHVNLLREKDGKIENFHYVSEFQGNKYLRLDLQSFITIGMIGGDFDKSKSVMINQRNIFQLLKGLDKCVENIYFGKVFAVNKSDKVIIYPDIAEKKIVKIYNLGDGNRLVLKPAIVYDENGLTYEGASMFINTTDNRVDLPIDALESMIYALKQLNIFVYSHLLLNYYMSTLKDGDTMSGIPVPGLVETPKLPYKKKPSIFESSSQDSVGGNANANSNTENIMSGIKEELST